MHGRCRFTVAVTRRPALIELATPPDSAGRLIPVGGTCGDSRRADRDLRAHGGRLAAGVEITEPQEVWSFDNATHRPVLRVWPRQAYHRYAKALRRYRFRAGIANVGLRVQRRDPWSDPYCGLTSAAPDHEADVAERRLADGVAANRTSPTLARTKPAAVRSGPMPTCRRGSTRPRPQRSVLGFARPSASVTRWAGRSAARMATTTPTTSAVTSRSAPTRPARDRRPTFAVESLAHTDSAYLWRLGVVPPFGVMRHGGVVAGTLERCCAPSSASPACPLWAMS